MNAKQTLLACAVFVLFAVGLVLFIRHYSLDEAARQKQDPATTTQVQVGKANSDEPVVAALQFLDDPRPEVQLFYKLAKAANFYNFNSEITYYHTNERPRMIDVGTPSHGSSIMIGLVTRAYSYYDGSDTRRKPEAAKDWYQCTGKWSEKEAIAETIHILEKLGEAKALSQISEGQPECEAVEFTVPNPNGQQVKVTPFYKVRLSNKQGRTIVEAEFRIGTNGPVGLTDWYYWP